VKRAIAILFFAILSCVVGCGWQKPPQSGGVADHITILSPSPARRDTLFKRHS